MSYILDALKKAERERGMNQVPTLSTVHEIDEKPAGRFRFLSAVALTLLAIGLGFFLFFQSRGDQPAAESRDYAEQQAIPDSQESASRDADGNTAASSPALNQTRSAASEKPPARQTGTPRTVSVIASDSKPGNTTGAARVMAREIPAAETPSQGTQRTAPPESSLPASLENPPQAMNLPTGDTGSLEHPVQSPDIADRESALRQAIETMQISILLFSENPSDRLVFINGRKYVEGNTIDGRFLLETITSDGVVLSNDGARAVLKLKTN